jgi:hypothetical protein
MMPLAARFQGTFPLNFIFLGDAISGCFRLLIVYVGFTVSTVLFGLSWYGCKSFGRRVQPCDPFCFILHGHKFR